MAITPHSDPDVVPIRSLAESITMWRPYESGTTIGRPGSEHGITVQDDEHEAGSRITLERDCGSAPWTITCGIYGWFFHTRFLGSNAMEEFTAMQDGLVAILDCIPEVDDPDADAKMELVNKAISEFVVRFP